MFSFRSGVKKPAAPATQIVNETFLSPEFTPGAELTAPRERRTGWRVTLQRGRHARALPTAETTMRMRMWCVVVLAAVALPSVAQAQAPYDNYPVCLRVYGPVRFDSCRFASIEQCRPSAFGIAGECVTNPWYQPPAGPAPRHRRH